MIESTWLIQRQPGGGKTSRWDRPLTNSASSAGRDSLEDESWDVELLQIVLSDHLGFCSIINPGGLIKQSDALISLLFAASCNHWDPY